MAVQPKATSREWVFCPAATCRVPGASANGEVPKPSLSATAARQRCGHRIDFHRQAGARTGQQAQGGYQSILSPTGEVMGIEQVQLSDDPRSVIDRQVAEGRAASEAEYVAEAPRLYAGHLEPRTRSPMPTWPLGNTSKSRPWTTSRLCTNAPWTASAPAWPTASLPVELRPSAGDRRLGRSRFSSERPRVGYGGAGRHNRLMLAVFAALGATPDLRGSYAIEKVAGVRT